MHATLKRSDLSPTRIGYWHGLDSPGLPHPIEFVDNAWSASERGAVVAHLKARKGRAVTAWRGFSHCRICGCTNGSEDISDGVYRWPSGYAHYIEVHDVKPPQAFIDHVLGSMKKEVKTMEKMCPTCHGTGQVREREPRDLLSWRAGNEYDVLGTATIFETCAAACLIATSKQSAVCFSFNDVAVEVQPGDDPTTIAKAWWWKAYGETEEESYARR
jgi:hypothetical protein